MGRRPRRRAGSGSFLWNPMDWLERRIYVPYLLFMLVWMKTLHPTFCLPVKLWLCCTDTHSYIVMSGWGEWGRCSFVDISGDISLQEAILSWVLIVLLCRCERALLHYLTLCLCVNIHCWVVGMTTLLLCAMFISFWPVHIFLLTRHWNTTPLPITRLMEWKKCMYWSFKSWCSLVKYIRSSQHADWWALEEIFLLSIRLSVPVCSLNCVQHVGKFFLQHLCVDKLLHAPWSSLKERGALGIFRKTGRVWNKGKQRMCRKTSLCPCPLTFP